MPPETDPNATDQDPIDDAIDAADPTPGSTTLAAVDVRNSPEYKTLARQNRKLARDLGNATSATSVARAEAEAARLAAEATQQAALDAELTATLGEDGVTFWSEFAELSQTDPVAAAKRLVEFRAAGAAAQSAAPATDPAAGDPDAQPEDGKMSASTPPPPSRGVDGGAPIQQPADDDPTKLVEALTQTYNDMVERVQNPVTRNRVTMKDRANGFIAYIAAAYVKATGNKPRDARR